MKERDAQLLVDLRRASAMAIPRTIVSRYATTWAECPEGALTGHQYLAILCRYRCRLLRAAVPHGAHGNTELNQRLQLREAGEGHDLIGKFWDSSTLDKKAEQRKPCSRRPKNSVGKEPAPLRPEDPSAMP